MYSKSVITLYSTANEENSSSSKFSNSKNNLFNIEELSSYEDLRELNKQENKQNF